MTQNMKTPNRTNSNERKTKGKLHEIPKQKQKTKHTHRDRRNEFDMQYRDERIKANSERGGASEKQQEDIF